MADPRFYDNRGPFRLSELCRIAQMESDSEDQSSIVHDVAALDCAGPPHLAFSDSRSATREIITNAGWCIVGRNVSKSPSRQTRFLRSQSVIRSFAVVARQFYPEHEFGFFAQEAQVHVSARIGMGVTISFGVVIGANAEIGDGTRIGPHCVIGRGVAIGRSCEIGAHTVINFAYAGDDVIVQPGAVIGGSGFGFASGPDGHWKIPQLGRVIIQDRVEIGANSTIDRGALGDTVIGEGCKIDNLVQIGHNTQIGRHCVIAGQAGVAGSVVFGDFVAVGGMAAIADHVKIGDHARLAGLTGVTRDLEAGRDYGGIPARPIREWHRQTAHLARVTRRKLRTGDD